MNVLDLFCGAVGGWSHGLHRAGYRTVAACEIDPWRCDVFAEQFPDVRMYADVREISADQIRRDIGYLPDVVVGSPPCQQISSANTKGTGITDDHLFWEWARIVFEVRPLWCAAENSPRSRTEGIDGVLDALAQAGYAAWPCVVGADNAGANHRRKRLWLIAADAERIGIRQQPGRCGGASRTDQAIPGEHDPDADARDVAARATTERTNRQGGEKPHRGIFGADDPNPDGRQPSRARRNAHGCVGMGARADADGAHANGAERRSITPDAGYDLDSDRKSVEGLARPKREPRTQTRYDACDLADPDRTRRAVGPCLGSHDGSELPAALRAIGASWPDWNGGLAGLAEACAAAGFGALDDGGVAGLPAGLRNRAIAALGDAVVDKIPEAIGRAMIDLTT